MKRSRFLLVAFLLLGIAFLLFHRKPSRDKELTESQENASRAIAADHSGEEESAPVDDASPVTKSTARPMPVAAGAVDVIELRDPPVLSDEEKARRAKLVPRIPFEKTPVVKPEGNELQVMVKFMDPLRARPLDDGRVSLIAKQAPAELVKVIEEFGVRFEDAFGENSAKMAALVARAEQASGNAQADLNGTLIATGSDRSPDGAFALATRLNRLPQVEYAYLEALDRRPLPPVDIAPPTGSFVANQNYRNATFGTRVDLAAGEYGASGRDMRFGDTEWAANINHEDLTDASGTPLITDVTGGVMLQVLTSSGGNPATPLDHPLGGQHGTAVMGIMAAGDNGYGVTGVVPDTKLFFASEFVTGARPVALGLLVDECRAGDVILLEQQTNGPFPASEFNTGGNGPADLDPTVWNTVKAATDCGIVVVITAGNGNADLDRDTFIPYRSRGDNGAIINGAGTSNNTHFKLNFSSHGTPVHLQGWGQNVAATGYGNLANVDGWTETSLIDGQIGNQLYTGTFNGTSSAGPIVASACVAVQSVAKAELKRTLSPRELRQLLIDTGTPQTLGGGVSSGIGTYEAESLTVASVSGTAVTTSSGGGASGDFKRLETTAVGNSFEFTLPNINRGSYVVKVRQITSSDLGIYQLSHDDSGGGFTNLGATVDQYRSSCCAANVVTVGTASFTNSGPKKIRFTVTGQNANAGSNRIAVDQIIIEDSVGWGKVGPLPDIAAAIRELLGTPVAQTLDAAGSYTQAFDSGTPVPAGGWTLLDGGQHGRTRIVDGALRMDTTGDATTNAAILHLDLAGKSGVFLSYDWRDNGDETNALTMAAHTGIRPGDGVCISADGQTWYGVTEWSPQSRTDGVWQREQLDLDAAIATAGISYSDDFRIRFQHHDDSSWPFDGIELDNVVVRTSSTAELALSVRSLGLSTIEGESPAPVTFAVINRGNASAPFTINESLPWASVSPSSGTVPAGGSVNITATFDTSALSFGLFSGSIDLAGVDYIWINGVVHGASSGDTYRNYDSTPLATIPGSGPADRYPIPITVNGMEGRIVNLDVHLWGITHTHFDDLDILLVGPDGREVLLMSDAGGSDDLTDISLLFDDDAPGPVDNGIAPVSGSYQPSDYNGSGDPFPGRPVVDSRSTSLATFNDADPNGTWTLWVVDDFAGDSGSIRGYTLYITTDTGLGGIVENFSNSNLDPFDLDGTSILFTPDDSDAGFSHVPSAITALPTTHGAAAKEIELTDDSSVPWFTGAQPFPFRGVNHETVQVCSNGYIAFGEESPAIPSNLSTFLSRQAIAALSHDLNPTAGGTVKAENFPDRSVITWEAVPVFSTTNSNTFQIELFYDGRIRISWLGIDATTAVVGISAGFGEADITETDFVIPRRPFTPGHVPHAIPGMIQAEDYDEATLPPLAYLDYDATNNGGAYRPDEGVDIENCTDVGGGYNIAFTEYGEWIEHTVDVASAGRYSAYVRVANPSIGGGFNLEFEGVSKTGDFYFDPTGAFQTFRTYVVTGMSLDAGVQTLRTNWAAANVNLNHITFVKEDAGNEPGLVAHWKFDASSGAAVSDAAGDHDGAIHGATGWMPTGGVNGGALDFSGSDNWITVPTDDLLKLRALNNAYTVSTWVNLDSAANQAILYHGLGCSSWASWHLAVGQLEVVAVGFPGSLVFSSRSANNSVDSTWLVDPSPVETGQWVHAAATYDGATLRFYVNGSEVGSTPHANALPFDSPESNFHIGADPGCLPTGRTPMDGRIDDVRIYVHALTAQEIQAQAYAGLPPGEDRDHDGQSNEAEIAFGTNPFDRTSVFLPEVSKTAGGGNLVEFPGVTGHSYHVQYSPDLSVPFTTIASFNPVADGPVSFTDTDSVRTSASKGFYRILAP
ncbi:LamG-like jellyroll fold domain-containing protein [Luteolibacter marinus]|uniref:LamG-like jellyroll fold domain-containing protein n=1 Tax=Luteolibacter marinus TaxID=2776705 RepID=UPI0018688B24|nr:LamG-like jellyroll fold domain-containing protein [Luteolibacter marinus]